MPTRYAHSDTNKEVTRQKHLLNDGDFNSCTIAFMKNAAGGAEKLRGKVIIDLGCGNGDLSCQLAKLVGSEGAQYRALGNAIPPVLMWHVTKQVLEILKGKKG